MLRPLLLLLMLLPLVALAERRIMVFSAPEESVYTQIAERVMQEAYSQLDMDVRIEQYSTAMALTVSSSGRVDGELFRVAAVQHTYTSLRIVPTPILSAEAVAVSLDEIVIEQWSDLENYRVGIKLGSKFAEAGTAAFSRRLAHSTDELFELLTQRKVDVVVMTYLDALSRLPEIKGAKVAKVMPMLESGKAYHYLHQKNVGLVPKIDQVLKRMEADGRIRQIRQEVIDELGFPQIE